MTGCFIDSGLDHGIFLKSDISQGSVVTQLRCGEIISQGFVANLLVNLSVKEVWKSVNICWRNGQYCSAVFFFDSQCTSLQTVLVPSTFYCAKSSLYVKLCRHCDRPTCLQGTMQNAYVNSVVAAAGLQDVLWARLSDNYDDWWFHGRTRCYCESLARDTVVPLSVLRQPGGVALAAARQGIIEHSNLLLLYFSGQN